MKKDVCAIVQRFRRKAKDLEEFRCLIGELGETLMLNLNEELMEWEGETVPAWRAITAQLWDNDQSCTCQTRLVLCPCCPGVQAAKDGGECFCGLFVGH